MLLIPVVTPPMRLRHCLCFLLISTLGLCPTARAVVATPASYLADVVDELEREWPRNRAMNVVCHGHSVPAGYFKTPVVDSLNAYPAQLQRALQARFPFAVVNVIVSAIGGENSVRGAARFDRDVLGHRPDVVCIDYSLNDRGPGLAAARLAWVAMIQKARAAGAQVILLTPTPDLRITFADEADTLHQHAAQVRQLAAEYGTGLVDSLAHFEAEVRAGTPPADLMSQVNHPNARGHQLVAAALATWFPASPPGPPSYANPLVRQRADPHLTFHTDGYYYFAATVPEYDRLELRRARNIHGLGAAEPRTIWRKHASGPMGSPISAPELHFIGGKWYLYFAAGGAEQANVSNFRIYVLENPAPNPLEGEWVECGQLKTNGESFALDATTFEHRGTRYLAWAQQDPKLKGNTNLYLAKMDSPVSIVGPQVMLSRPEFPWEQIRYGVNEGPAVLIRNGRVFLTYSAVGTGPEYCLGLLTADANADLLDPRSWKKSPEPVFATNSAHGIFGPGHNSFTKSSDNKTDLLVYHARSYRETSGDPLHDPNRHTRIQPIVWRPDGTPDFGVPPAEVR